MQPLKSCVLFLLLGISSVFLGAQRPRWAVHPYSAGELINQTVVADVNRDGKPDLIQLVQNQTIAVWLGNGDGTVQASKNTTVPNDFLFQIAVIDLDRDGKSDILALGTEEYYVLRGKGDGTFDTPVLHPVSVFSTSMAVGDLNNDGYPDLVMGNEIWLNDHTGNFFMHQMLFHWDLEEAMQFSYFLRDFNHDGRKDLVIIDPYMRNEIMSYRNDGAGNFTGMQNQSLLFAANGLGAIYAADLNNDGKLDLLLHVRTTCSQGSCPAGIMILLGNGDCSFQSPQIIDTTGIAGLGDVNRDGKLDLVIATQSGGSYQLLTYLNDGTGHFANPRTTSAFACIDFLMADLNGDGFSDLLCDTATGTQVLLSNGDGTYTGGVKTTNSPSSLVVPLTDLNGDGAKDAILNVNSGTSFYVLANLSGTRVTPSTSPASLVYREPFSLSSAVVPSITPNVSNPPSGTVTFKDGSSLLGTTLPGASIADSGGLNTGTHTLTVSYSGDSNFNPHAVTFTRIVAKATSHTSLTSSLNPSIHVQSVTFTAKVLPQYAGTPTGKVTFKSGTTALATVSLVSGKATYSTSSLSIGTHSITVSYSGDGNFHSSTSPVLLQKVM